MTARKSQKDERTAELFASPSGARAVDGKVRMAILSMLRQNEMSFDDIVSSSGKAKSTISVHLKHLVEEGIIGSREDPDDARKKTFHIRSGHLGGFSRRLKADKDMEEYISNNALNSGDPFKFFKLMFRTFRTSLLTEGIDIDPLLHDAGMKVGQSLSRKIEDRTITGLLDNLVLFWKEQGMGRIEVERVEPLAIRIYDCFECQDLPIIGRPACAFDSGILTTIFSWHFDRKMDAIETHCYAMGDDHCRFEVRKVA